MRGSDKGFLFFYSHPIRIKIWWLFLIAIPATSNL